jgi:hypothetical protein
MDKKIFRSRISVLLGGFILVLFTLSAALMFYYSGAIVAACIIYGVLLLLFALIAFGMRYVIIKDKLYIEMLGIREKNIDIKDIISVRRSYNPLSSPAASLKRLSIHLKNRKNYQYLFISPVREQEFLDILKSVNPDIDIQVSEKKGKWRIWDWDI